ncbi:MAG: DUF992 domain-containing protein, partial [Pseudolabrys sp.]
VELPRDGNSPSLSCSARTVSAIGGKADGLHCKCLLLTGGSGRTFALQPVSLEGSVAVDVALGVSALKLRPVP